MQAYNKHDLRLFGPSGLKHAGVTASKNKAIVYRTNNREVNRYTERREAVAMSVFHALSSRLRKSDSAMTFDKFLDSIPIKKRRSLFSQISTFKDILFGKSSVFKRVYNPILKNLIKTETNQALDFIRSEKNIIETKTKLAITANKRNTVRFKITQNLIQGKTPEKSQTRNFRQVKHELNLAQENLKQKITMGDDYYAYSVALDERDCKALEKQLTERPDSNIVYLKDAKESIEQQKRVIDAVSLISTWVDNQDYRKYLEQIKELAFEVIKKEHHFVREYSQYNFSKLLEDMQIFDKINNAIDQRTSMLINAENRYQVSPNKQLKAAIDHLEKQRATLRNFIVKNLKSSNQQKDMQEELNLLIKRRESARHGIDQIAQKLPGHITELFRKNYFFMLNNFDKNIKGTLLNIYPGQKHVTLVQILHNYCYPRSEYDGNLLEVVVQKLKAMSNRNLEHNDKKLDHAISFVLSQNS